MIMGFQRLAQCTQKLLLTLTRWLRSGQKLDVLDTAFSGTSLFMGFWQ